MHINNNTRPWFKSIADSNQGHTGQAIYQHIYQDISAPQTRINLLFALLKPCFQASSFEYNYVEFEEILFLFPRRAM
jgi:hypothetical protein